MSEKKLFEIAQIQTSQNPKYTHQSSIEFFSHELMQELCGTLDRHLKILSNNLSVLIAQRGSTIQIRGDSELISQAQNILTQLIALISSGSSIEPADVDQISRMLRDDPEVNLGSLMRQTIFQGKKKRIYPRSVRQLAYFQSVQKNDLVFGIGPAGTGKSYLAMAMALSALTKDDVRKIILCRPAVEAGEKLGFLPGDLLEKVDPYLRPLYDALFELMGGEKAARMIERELIEIAPLAFMRGRTLSNAFVILDEAQNTTIEQMKMFLTRIGNGSKVIVNGDPSQIDLPNKQPSGLAHALKVLDGIDGIARIELTAADVVRHPLVARIVRAYAHYEKRKHSKSTP